MIRGFWNPVRDFVAVIIAICLAYYAGFFVRAIEFKGSMGLIILFNLGISLIVPAVAARWPIFFGLLASSLFSISLAVQDPKNPFGQRWHLPYGGDEGGEWIFLLVVWLILAAMALVPSLEIRKRRLRKTLRDGPVAG